MYYLCSENKGADKLRSMYLLLLMIKKSYTERTNILYFCVTSTYITVKIQYGGVRSAKYLANYFCDTLASINLIYVSFVIFYNEETDEKM